MRKAVIQSKNIAGENAETWILFSLKYTNSSKDF